MQKLIPFFIAKAVRTCTSRVAIPERRFLGGGGLGGFFALFLFPFSFCCWGFFKVEM